MFYYQYADKRVLLENTKLDQIYKIDRIKEIFLTVGLDSDFHIIKDIPFGIWI